MIHTLSSDSHFYAFSRDLEPALRVADGDEVIIETKDCFSDQLKTDEDTLEQIDWDAINPATGPVFVEGAQPGDVLKVEILKIEVGEQTCGVTGEDEGLCGHRFKGFTRRYSQVDNELKILTWDDKVAFEIDPMIGVIGVAPAGEPVSCGTPDAHGGNMDNTMIREGATLYFPVSVEGALFGCGDMHALMGDGEIGASGAEVAGKAHLRLSVVKGRTISSPVLMDSCDFATIASAATFDEAAQKAVNDMVDLLEPQLGLSREDLVILLSLCADVEVCQLVDPQKTARFVVSRDVLDAYGFTW